MKKIVLTFGLIAGAILSAMMLAITIPFQDAIGFDHGEIIGYTSMVVAFLLIFFGVRSYRDNVAGGTVAFGRAFAVGALDRSGRVALLRRDLGGHLLQVCAGLRHEVSGAHPREGASGRRERGSHRQKEGRVDEVRGALPEPGHQCGHHVPRAAAGGVDRRARVGRRAEPPEESGLRHAACTATYNPQP